MNLETTRLRFAELSEADLPDLHRLYADPAVNAYLGTAPASDDGRARTVLAAVRADYARGPFGYWAIRQGTDGAFVGTVGLELKAGPVNGHANFVNLGFMLLPAYWGRGYGSEAARACLDHGFGSLHLAEVCAYVDERHLASRRILEKVGLRQTGPAFEDLGDRCLWYVARNPHPSA